MIKRTVLLIVALALLLAAGCTVQDPHNGSSEDAPAESRDTSFDADTSSSLMLEEISYDLETEGSLPSPTTELLALFSSETRSDLPAELSKSQKSALREELEAVLETKSYSEEAKEMLRNTMDRVMASYADFHALFSFFNVPDCEGYLRNLFIAPLRDMVDEIIITDNQGSGSASDSTKTMTISRNYDSTDAVVIVHELWHMAVATEHYIHDSTLYMHLNEGGATFAQLVLLGSHYKNIQSLRGGASGAIDLENTENVIRMINHGNMKYSEYFGIWYRLFTLTDFDTMALFFKPDGERLIRDELIKKYGEDGEAFYDLLISYYKRSHPASVFDNIIEFESLYLKMLKGRLSEVESKQEMLAFLQMYRLTRLALGSEYVRTYYIETPETGNVAYTETLVHPDLDYIGTDKAVAEAVYNWHILNKGALTDDMEYALAYCTVAPPHTEGVEEHKVSEDALYNELALCSGYSYNYAVTEEGNIVFYFECYDSLNRENKSFRIYDISAGTSANIITVK